MAVIVKLSGAQVEDLKPLFGRKDSTFLVASVFADGNGWSLQIHAIPAARRLATRAALDGSLKLPKARKAKAPVSSKAP